MIRMLFEKAAPLAASSNFLMILIDLPCAILFNSPLSTAKLMARVRRFTPIAMI